MTQSKTDVKILVGYHKPYSLLKSKNLIPIHTGRAVALAPTKDVKQNSSADNEWLVSNMIGDDTGDNISTRNRNYNELTALYWAWKNYDQLGNPSHFGFMQYRRHLIFNEDAYIGYEKKNADEKAYAKRNVGYVYDSYSQDFGLTDEFVNRYAKRYDIILPEDCLLEEVGVESVKQDYTERIEGTHESDLRVLLSVVKQYYPEYFETLKTYLESNKKRCYQMFVLKKGLFFDYCKFLFDILGKVDERIDTSAYSVNGQRTIGYLGEILYGVYFKKLIENNAKLKIKELGTTYLSANNLPQSIKAKTAIVLLAFSDFESLEITLAAYGKTLQNTDTKLFVLQNGRGTYDTERTYRVAQRYADLYPCNIEVVDDIAPQKPYTAIRTLLNSERLKDYEYICKVDDDAFPLTDDWLDRLCELYEEKFAKIGSNLAYVSGLVNNNPFGFKQIVTLDDELSKEYFTSIAIDHKVGIRGKKKGYGKEQTVSASEINDDINGTVWGYPYIARWLHERTTLKPEDYIKRVKGFADKEVGERRYSINNMLFAKQYWNDIYDQDALYVDDDEYLSEQYCKKNGKSVFVKMSVPFVHIFFFAQREENKDLIPAIREVYQKFLGVKYPIAIQSNKDFENENRMRFIEAKIGNIVHLPHKPRTIKRIEHVVRKVGDKAAPKGTLRRKPLAAVSRAIKRITR